METEFPDTSNKRRLTGEHVGDCADDEKTEPEGDASERVVLYVTIRFDEVITTTSTTVLDDDTQFTSAVGGRRLKEIVVERSIRELGLRRDG